ncbi:MAG: sigma factor [Gordonia paraffinivorans]
MDRLAVFENERPRLVAIAARVLRDPDEAQDVVQQTWIRLQGTSSAIDNLPGWLTTVTTRLCIDRLRSAVPAPEADPKPGGSQPDPADETVVADSVGRALQAVHDHLTPTERVAFVLHDSFAIDFDTVADVLGVSTAAARKAASRARAKVVAPVEHRRTDWEVVDAFLRAARDGEFSTLIRLLAPDVVVAGDPAAIAAGTPGRIDGRDAVAAMFDGAARSALPVFVDGRPGAAWFLRGEARVAFDFTVVDGMVTRIDFRADPAVLAVIRRRRDDRPQGGAS